MAEATKGKKKNPLSGVFDVLGGVFKPILSVIIAAGVLQALRDILLMTGAISRVSSSYIFLNALGDCVFYFLPIFLALSSAKVFNTSQYMAGAVAAFLLYPDITDLFEWAHTTGWNLTLFGSIPVTYSRYPSSVLPIILIIYFQSKVEPVIKKIIPDILQVILVPMLTMFITCIVGLVILGPIGTWLGNLISFLVTSLDNVASWLVPTLIGALTPFLVITGSHYSLFPVVTQNLAQLGYDTVMMPGNLASNLAFAGASFAIAIKARNKKYKSYCTSAGVTCLFGIAQSSLYGIAIPLKTPLRAGVIAGGIGGFFAGITQIKCHSFMTPGLLSLLGYISESRNLIFAILTCVISFATAFALTSVFGFEEPIEDWVNELTEAAGEDSSDSSEDKKSDK